MADTKNKEELVPLRIDRIPDPKADQDVFISVNFKNIIVRRGETVMVKPEFKRAWEESQKAMYEALDFEASEMEKNKQ